MNRQAVVSTAVAPIHKQASFSSEMITQALMWENAQILGMDANWYQICMEDGYDGWIHSFYLHHREPPLEEYLFITKRAVPVFHEIEQMESIIALLSFGTYLPLAEKAGDFLKIHLPDGNTGYIEPQKQVVKKSRKTIIKLATSLLGVPYLWGGKSSFGYDCSGFVQMVLKTVGVGIHRDTSQQIQADWLERIDIHDAQPGDLMFFLENNRTNHVAFILGEGNIIHCSGKVKIESIKEGEPAFSKILSQLTQKAYSIIKKVVS